MHSMVHGVERDGGLGGVGGTGTAEFRVIACRYGSVFGMIHIHKGEGIGVSKFFGLFSVQALTLVCKLLNMHTHTMIQKEQHSCAQF